MDCAVDFSPGGVWIGNIRPGLEDGSLIDAAPVTGHLSPLLCSAAGTCIALLDFLLIGHFVVRTVSFLLDIKCVSSVSRWIAERWTMAANGASVVDDRAGIRLVVELYVPWDAPEAGGGCFVGWCCAVT